MFIHLNLHSHYSLLRGTASPEELCGAVKAQGGKTIALTDTNGLYGLVLFLEAAKDHGLRPIIGAEIRHSVKEVRHSCLTEINAEQEQTGMSIPPTLQLSDDHRAIALVKDR